VVNAYLRRCARKGLIKVRQVPLNRYAYYLTPQGFAEKARRTAEFLAVSFSFFRLARSDCAELFGDCTAWGWRRVALFGAGDLAEIAALSAGESNVRIVCIVDPLQAGRPCAGLPVVADFAAAQRLAAPHPVDGVILTDTANPQASFKLLCQLATEQKLAAGRIAAPRLLEISPGPASAVDAPDDPQASVAA
jgi:hypothetical protein